MTRKTKLMLNSVSSLMYQVVTLVCGFLLPRVFLSFYGSAVNGLVTSITQFLGFISLAECGVGAVVQSTLYKPLADEDIAQISRIVVSAGKFFKRIAYVLVGYTALLMLIYPFATLSSFDYVYTMALIFVISISTFAQYYLGMTYKLLLNADQLGFIQYTIHAIALILNTVLCILFMTNGAPVHVVKLTTSIIFLVQPILLSLIAKRRYKIDRKVQITEEPIKQKWNGFAQHVASVVLGNTDTVVLTLFSTLENVSVYAVYHLVVNGVKQIIVSMTNGTQAMLGNMLANNETEQLNTSFDYIECLLHFVVTFVFSVTAILIVPFVKVYTKDIGDADYIVPAFAYLITLAQASYCIRLPYNTMVLAAGHYKQTQWSAVVEATLNVIISVVLVFKFGLVGVAIGTLVAMVYRTFYLALYLSKNILYRKMRFFVKHLVTDAVCVTLTFAFVKLLPQIFTLEKLSYMSWIWLAVKVSAIGAAICLFINIVFWGSKVKNLRLLRRKKNI